MRRAIVVWLAACAVAALAAAQTLPTPGVVAPAPPANPYSATVPVAGTSDAQRTAAIGAALTQVLQQVSPGFVASPDALAQAPGYVRDFHYQRAPGGAGLQLEVDFDPGAIGRLVAQGAPGAAGTPSAPGATPAGAASTGAPAAGTAAAGSASGAGTGTLWVEGLGDGPAFASLLSELRGDPALHDVTPVAAKGEGVLLKLTFDRPLAEVLAALETPAGHLEQVATPHPGADVTLRWVP